MIKKRSLLIVLTLAPFIFTYAFALDVYVPAIPTILDYFHASTFTIQLTVSLFLLLTGAGQLFWGPISDSFGRRKVIYFGVLSFLVGSLLASFSFHIAMLITARVIQGLGASCMMVATFAMVRDLFEGDECAEIYSLLNSGIALSPLIAPVIGGYLDVWFGWRSAFIFLTIVGLLLVVLAQFKLKESLAVKKRRAFSMNFLRDYWIVCKDGHFRVYTFCAAAGFACFLTFFSVSSYIFIKLLGVPQQHFGFYFALNGVVFFIGSLLSSRSAKMMGTHATVLVGGVLVFLAGLGMLSWYYCFGLSILGFMGPMVIMCVGGAFLIGAGAGGAIEPFPEMSGAASAVFGAFEFLFAFAVSSFVLKWQVVSTVPLAVTLIVLGSCATVACFVLKFVVRKR